LDAQNQVDVYLGLPSWHRLAAVNTNISGGFVVGSSWGSLYGKSKSNVAQGSCLAISEVYRESN
jgi:hypothetical protein